MLQQQSTHHLKTHCARRFRLHPKTGVIALVAAALFITLSAEASRFGRSGFSGNPDTNGGSDCSVCHAPDGVAAPTVIINGPVVLDAGTTGRYSVSMLGVTAITGGVNSTAVKPFPLCKASTCSPISAIPRCAP